MIVEILKAVILGIVEGITEWLPISSTGHLILVDEFIKLAVSSEFKEMFEVVIQLGAILAVIVIYFKNLFPWGFGKTKEDTKDTFSMWFKVIVACIPTILIAVFDDWINDHFYNVIVVSLMLIIYGVLYIIVENANKNSKSKCDNIKDLSYKQALLVGIFQMLAVIPGTSRSGSTILGGLMIGLSREVAAEFTFFLAIPVMFGASLLKVLKYILKVGLAMTSTELAVLIIGCLVAFIVSILAIKFLMRYIKKNDFKPFGWYRIVLGIFILLFFWLR